MNEKQAQRIVELRRAEEKDADTIWKLQREAFAGLLAKYQDYDTSPANEAIERITAKLKQPYSYFYYIMDDNKVVGVIRIVDKQDGSRKRISPIFIKQEERNKGYGQAAIRKAEDIHGQAHWTLATILQEEGNCYLYEKMGYHKTGQTTPINEKMTIVGYEKN